MLIGIEATRANKPTKTGVEWYAWHLIQELKTLTQDDQNAWLLYTNDPLSGGLERLPRNWHEARAAWPLPYGWTQLRLSWELFRRPVDVLFLPGSTMPRYAPKRSVVTVHDVGFRRHPELYKPRQVSIHHQAMKENARRAARIVTVSQFSAHEIAETYGVDPARIIVTSNGIDHAHYRPLSDRRLIDETLVRYRLAQPFFVAVGRLEAKKNLRTLIQAFERFKARRGQGDPHQLVLIGTPGFRYEDIQRAIATSPARAAIRELGYVSESDLPLLLNAAHALVHPSWYEGFGVPPLQAMACGCPVISSAAGSLPEVIGRENALFFPPDQAEALVTLLDRIVDDAALHTRLRVDGIARAVRYTWRATAEQTLPALTTWT